MRRRDSKPEPKTQVLQLGFSSQRLAEEMAQQSRRPCVVEEFVSAEPVRAALVDLVGLLCRRQDELEVARRDAAEMRELATDNLDVCFHLGADHRKAVARLTHARVLLCVSWAVFAVATIVAIAWCRP